jgi:hypothetical protein
MNLANGDYALSGAFFDSANPQQNIDGYYDAIEFTISSLSTVHTHTIVDLHHEVRFQEALLK